MDSYSKQEIVKGVSNHRRIEILYLLDENSGLSVEEIAGLCKAGYKTIAVHIRRLTTSGLISKKYYGRRVEHRITDRGKFVLTFLRTLE